MTLDEQIEILQAAKEGKAQFLNGRGLWEATFEQMDVRFAK